MKFSRLIALLSAAMLFLGVSAFAQKEAKGSIESKIALESSMENRLKQVLTEITGTEKIIVIVNVQLAAEKKEAASAEKKDDFILPGVPIKEAINEKQVGEAVMAALGEDTRTLIRKLTVTVILDKGVSTGVINIVKEVTTGLLGIDAERGDQLIVKQMNFQKNPFYWGMLLFPPNIYWVILVLAAASLIISLTLFMFGPFKSFTREFVGSIMATASALKENGKSGGEENVFTGPVGAPVLSGTITETGKASGLLGSEAPFSFVDETNLNSLIYLIKDDSPENAAAIISYLPPALGSKLLAALPAEKQKAAGSRLAQIRELDASEIDVLEAKIKKRIGYLSGGAEKLVSILDYADEKTKAVVLGSVKASNPQVSEQVQKALVSVEMLAGMDVSGLSMVIKAVTPAVFGQVIKSFNADLRDKVLGILPEGAAARIRQEMEMGKDFNPARIEIEKRRIVDILKKLEARGLISRS